MSRIPILVLGMSLLAVSTTAALADGEGTYSPVAVASPAQGRVVDAGTRGSFIFSQGEGGQAEARPVIAAPTARSLPIASGSFQFNAGQNG
jgi:hypothetical protein